MLINTFSLTTWPRCLIQLGLTLCSVRLLYFCLPASVSEDGQTSLQPDSSHCCSQGGCQEQPLATFALVLSFPHLSNTPETCVLFFCEDSIGCQAQPCLSFNTCSFYGVYVIVSTLTPTVSYRETKRSKKWTGLYFI